MGNELYDENATEIVTKCFVPLLEKLDAGEIVAGTVELLNVGLVLDPRSRHVDFGTIKKAPRKYQEHEADWYDSMDLGIRGHDGIRDNPIWSSICTDDGRVNSNYGWCVYSPENGDGVKSQYDFALEQLRKSPDGRQSVIFYSRPSMQWEWNDGVHAKHDFCCTFQTVHHVRGNKLFYTVLQRSCDTLLGLVNDFFHHARVYEKMLSDLRTTHPDVGYGYVYYFCNSLHAYERHWDLLREVVREYRSTLG